ncbi:MAG: branched-chain amino acid ABC transporter permease [Alphaproteobacteria bacterium]
MTHDRPAKTAFGVLALFALPLVVGSTYIQHMMVLWAMYALLALSLNIIIGYLGELTFGHAAFFGIGAYTSAILSIQLGLPVIIGPFVAAVVAGLFGLVIGFVALRIVGPQFAILTLGFGAILHTVTNYWVDLTRGPMGISNIPSFALPGLEIDFTLARNMYYVVLVFLLAIAYLCHALISSRTGRAFLALRENPQLASSIGINVFGMKLLGFVAATAIAGLGGSLYGHYLRVITPELMSLQYMAALVIMVIIGGKGTIIGPMVGALVYVGLLELLRATGSLRLVVFAALLTACVIFLPGGLVSLWRRVRDRRRTAPTPEAAA